MRTLPDLFDALAEHGDHAGADAVVARAVAAAHAEERVVSLRAPEPARRNRRPVASLVAIAVTIALVAVPIAVRGTKHAPHPSRQPSGPPYPPPDHATTTQLAAMHWSHIAKAPISLIGANQVVAWAGDEVIVFGEDALHEDPHGAGAAYSPATDTWRVLPKAPLKGDFFFGPSWTWTGRELIVFPNTGPDTEAPVGEAYSPRTDSWRKLAPAPLCTVARAGIAWTGAAVVLAGGYNISGSRCADEKVARSAFYDPRTDRWTLGPRLPVRADDRLEVTRLAWADGRVVAVVASQRRVAGSANTTPTAAPSSTTLLPPAVGGDKDPIVRVLTLRPGDRSWTPIGDLTNGTSGETAQENWQPEAVGSRVVFPPSLRFCAEGRNMMPCGLAGVQPGLVYDVDSKRGVVLAIPKLAYANDLDAAASTGDALYASLYAGTSARTFAWDLTTGRRVELRTPPGRVESVVWTGHELFAIAWRPDNQGSMGLRLGP